MSNKQPNLIAYIATKNGDKNIYTRVGAVWFHNEGDGQTLKLNALPINGELVMFPPKEKKENS